MTSMTIFTPTYNRAYILPMLYDSLLKQTNKKFEWIIVDDGSEDNTEEVVNKWVEDGLIKIKYYKQENSGKHIAINTGVFMSECELFFIVDSDDTLTNDAIEKVLNIWTEKNNKDNISGIIAYRKFLNEEIIGKRIPEKIEYSTLKDIYKVYNAIGDKVVVYRTDVLKKYLFPNIKGEKFFLESYVYNQIDMHYKMIILQEAIYYCEYLEDGLSQDFRKLYRNNPKGFKLAFEQDILLSTSAKERFKPIIHYCCLCIKLKEYKDILRNPFSFEKLMYFPFSVFMYVKIFVLKVSDVKVYKNY